MKKDITLSKVDFGQFEIRVSESKVVIQTKNKDWSTVYKKGTNPYDFIANLVFADASLPKDMSESEIATYRKNSMDTLRTVSVAIYTQTMFFKNIELVKGWFDIVSPYMTPAKNQATNEEDADALEDVKNMEKIKDSLKEEIAADDEPTCKES